MEFTVKIKLGNDTMQLSNEVAECLVKVAAQLNRYPVTKLEIGDGYAILDNNGNKVGHWEIS